MTDLERTQQFLDSLDVPYTMKIWEQGLYDKVNALTVTAKSSSKVVGYSDFVVEFEFSLDGEFNKMGIWE